MKIMEIRFSDKAVDKYSNSISINDKYQVKKIEDNKIIKTMANEKADIKINYKEKLGEKLEGKDLLILSPNKKTNDITTKMTVERVGNIISPLPIDNRICRICYLNEEESKNPLIKPCNCSGSLKYIHFECLKKWITTNYCVRVESTEDSSIFMIKPIICELCKTKLPNYINHNGKFYPTLDFRNEFQSYLSMESLSMDRYKNHFIYVISLDRREKIKVGRGHNANILLSDVSVSRVHCILNVERKCVFLEDNNSKFSTLVLVQTPQINLVNNLPLYIQIGNSFIDISIQMPFKFGNCCNCGVDEKQNNNYYHLQNKKEIDEKKIITVKIDENEYIDYEKGEEEVNENENEEDVENDDNRENDNNEENEMFDVIDDNNSEEKKIGANEKKKNNHNEITVNNIGSKKDNNNNSIYLDSSYHSLDKSKNPLNSSNAK